MNIHSINFKISAVFVFVIVVFNILFFGFLESQKKLEEERLKKGFFEITRAVLITLNHFKESPTELLRERFAEMGIELIDKNRAEKILEDSKFLLERKIRHDKSFKAYKFSDKFLIQIRDEHKEIFVLDNNALQSPTKAFFVVYTLFTVILLGAFVLIINSLKPLKKLTKNIEKFSEGELCLDCKSNKKDEIAEVSNAFNQAAKRIKTLLDSRVLFLRMVIHELKTPITKGRVAAEMLETSKNRDRVIKSFEKINMLIDEFAKIERLNSKTYGIKIDTFMISDIIKKALELNFEEIAKQDQNIEDFSIECDGELMAIALKNIIENGIKYSTNKSVSISSSPTFVKVKSQGEPIKASIDEITKPFYRANGHSAGESLGLGLYIVKEILKSHLLELSYRYEEGCNIFWIDFSKTTA